MKRRQACALFVASSGFVLACTGVIDQAPGSGSDGSGAASGKGRGRDGNAANADALGAMPLRRLTQFEYDNTVRDLLGDETRPARQFTTDAIGSSGFRTPGLVALNDARNYMQVAERLAADAVQSSGFIGCKDGAEDTACLAEFIERFGRRAFRRPLTPQERDRFIKLHEKVQAELGYGLTEAARTLVAAMLQHPAFLYHWELGPRPPEVVDGSVRLDGYERASRLSYFLWGTMPDEALLTAAGAGELDDDDGIAKVAEKMLLDERARDGVAWFHEQWLSLTDVATLSKDPQLFPTFSSGLAEAMAEELRRFVSGTILGGDARLATLLTSRTSYVNAPLAELYGVSGTFDAGFAEVTLPAERTGVLTRAAFLASHAKAYETNPVVRGKEIFTRVMCGKVPPPPADIPELKPPAANLSTRDRFEQHSTDPTCKNCHQFMDPIGFALESFDAVGRHRTMDGNAEIDTTGSLSFGVGKEQPIANAAELMAALAGSEDVARCVAQQWRRFALARAEEETEATAEADTYKTFAASGHDVRKLLIELARSESFLYRRPSAGEITQ